MPRYIWQDKNWPEFKWDSKALLNPLGQVRLLQGRLYGEAGAIGLEQEAEVMTRNAVTTAAIEGERLDLASVRSSVARRLGLSVAGHPPTERHIDGLVEMLFDATVNCGEPLTGERLKSWQAALFPTGRSGLRKIRVGEWREGNDPMQVVSGAMGREKVHFEAPPSDRIPSEMERFFRWWGSPPVDLDGLLRAGVAHFWLVTIHPFEDGNGRVARAVADMALSQDEGTGRRLYCMSAQIHKERDTYYEILEQHQKGDGEITGWMVWFLECLGRSIQRSESTIRSVLEKARFWQQAAEVSLNKRQKKVVNRLLDAGPEGFEGGMTNRKYRGMTRTTRETAKRDLADLLEKGILVRNPGSGRSTSYRLVWPG